MAGDKDAFLAGVADARPGFYERQESLFDWMQTAPLESYRLAASWESGDLVRPSDRRSYRGAAEVSIPVTTERYRFRDYDTDAAVETMYYTFVKFDGRWKIAADTDLSDLGLRSARHLWDFGPLEVRREENFLLITHDCEGDSPRCSRLPAGFIALARGTRASRGVLEVALEP